MIYSTGQNKIRTNNKTALFAGFALFFGFVFMATFVGGVNMVLNTTPVYAAGNNAPSLTGVNNLSITTCDDTFDPFSGVSATDSDGDAVNITVSGENVLADALTNNTPGTYVLTYTADDGNGGFDIVDRDITVTAGNCNVPVANAVSVTTEFNTAKTITLNATDADGDTLTYSIVAGPSNGTLGSISGNTVVYTPTSGYSGSDTFTYKANDGTVDSNTATVTLTVNASSGGNNAPSLTGVNDVTINICLASFDAVVGVSATDADGDAVSITTAGDNVVDDALTNDTPGVFVITYTADDGNGGFDIVDREIRITSAACGGGGGGNNAPIATNISLTTAFNTVIPVTLVSSDADGDPITHSIVSTPSNGALGTLSGSNVTYTPTTGFSGTDTFTYKANDGTVDSNIATVTIVVSTGGGGGGGTPPVTPPCTSGCGGSGGSSNKAPVIYLLQINEIEVTVGGPFVDAPIKAEDYEEGDVTSRIVKDLSALNIDVVGEYTITYNVSDTQGLNAPQRQRLVRVIPGGGGNGPTTPTITTPQVCTYLEGFSRLNNTNPSENEIEEVAKVQRFMNEFQGANLNVTGIFDADTDAWVRAFQEQYRIDILGPWNHDAPTGYVYITTRKKINEIYCEREFPLSTVEQDEITAFRNRVIEAPATGTSNIGSAESTDNPSIRDLIGSIEGNDGTRSGEDILIGLDDNDGSLDIDNPLEIESENLAAASAANRNMAQNIAVSVYRAIHSLFNRSN